MRNPKLRTFLVRMILGLSAIGVGLKLAYFNPSARWVAFVAGGLIILDGLDNLFRGTN